jgi:hypothetical protein
MLFKSVYCCLSFFLPRALIVSDVKFFQWNANITVKVTKWSGGPEKYLSFINSSVGRTCERIRHCDGILITTMDRIASHIESKILLIALLVGSFAGLGNGSSVLFSGIIFSNFSFMIILECD